MAHGKYLVWPDFLYREVVHLWYCFLSCSQSPSHPLMAPIIDCRAAAIRSTFVAPPLSLSLPSLPSRTLNLHCHRCHHIHCGDQINYILLYDYQCHRLITVMIFTPSPFVSLLRRGITIIGHFGALQTSRHWPCPAPLALPPQLILPGIPNIPTCYTLHPSSQ